jgi:hypothetical protein
MPVTDPGVRLILWTFVIGAPGKHLFVITVWVFSMDDGEKKSI